MIRLPLLMSCLLALAAVCQLSGCSDDRRAVSPVSSVIEFVADGVIRDAVSSGESDAFVLVNQDCFAAGAGQASAGMGDSKSTALLSSVSQPPRNLRLVGLRLHRARRPSIGPREGHLGRALVVADETTTNGFMFLTASGPVGDYSASPSWAFLAVLYQNILQHAVRRAEKQAAQVLTK